MNRVVSRPAICHNVIAGRRRTRFLNVLKTGFPAAPATLHGHAINCVPVHRFRMGERRKQDLPRLNGVNFRAMLVRILMHAVKTEPPRVSGGFSGGLLPVLPVSVRNAHRGRPLSGGADNGCYGKCEKHFP